MRRSGINSEGNECLDLGRKVLLLSRNGKEVERSEESLGGMMDEDRFPSWGP